MSELSAEAAKINRDLSRILVQGNAETEAPLRLHSRDIDSGGAPEFHPAFLRWLDDRSVCRCGRPAKCAPGCRATRPDEHLAACERACLRDDMRFRPSIHKASPNRLKRALRNVRRLNPKAYDLVYLVAGRGWSYEAATARINATNLARGEPEQTSAEFAVLWVSGASMLVGSY